MKSQITRLEGNAIWALDYKNDVIEVLIALSSVSINNFIL